MRIWPGYAAGIFSNSTPLKQQWVKIARTIEPNRDSAPIYDALYAIYHQLYKNTREEMQYLAQEFR